MIFYYSLFAIFPLAGIFAMDDTSSLVSHIRSNNREEVESVLEENNLDLNDVVLFGRTMFHLAVSHRSLQVAQLLLERGSNPNKSDKDLTSPLHTLSLSSDGDDRHKQMIDLLLRCERLEVNPKDNNGNTPLHFAVEFMYMYLIQKLIAKGAEVF